MGPFYQDGPPSWTVGVVVVLLALTWIPSTKGDGNDWVSPVYVMNVASGKSDGSKSVPAQQRIIKAGVWSAKGGPWTVTDSNIQAPSGDQHDYLSWAPYHWPDCNWCTSKGDNAPKDSGQDPNADNAPQSSSTSSGPLSVQTVLPSTLPNWTPGQDGLTGMGLINGVLGPVEAGLATVVGAGSGLLEPVLGPVFRRDEGNEGGPSAESPLQDRDANPQHLLATSMWMDPNGWVDTNSATLEVPTPTTPPMLQPIWTAAPMPTATPLGAAPLAVPSISVPGSPTAAKSASATQTGSRTANSIQDGSTPASNGSGKNKGKSAGGGGEKSSSCTPSKTSMQPSATWTTCPYKVRDGKVNPDVRQLNDTQYIVSLSQAALWNGVAYGLTNDSSFAQRAADYLTTFFLDPRTAMNPSLDYAQLIRGPDAEGGYVGIVDFRGMVKIVNSIVILRAKGANEWNSVLATAMNKWATKYIDWLTKSDYGQKAAGVANNHATFYYNQLIALKILVGDLKAAQNYAQAYFTGPFMRQIVASGEQPFEAQRTRPFHYRCFNLEAMITAAKLADNLSLNMWSAKTSKGATIQDALDYTMTLDPGEEDVTELAPWVAAVAAAYGDPAGKYEKWLRNKENTGDEGKVQSWRFYNDVYAFYSSPARGNTKSSQQKPS